MDTLPARAIRIINEYSKPRTRPDWRKCKRMTQKILYEELTDLTNNIISIHTNIFDKVLFYMRETFFYKDLMMYKLNALKLNY
jgi:hypothetical protein